MKADFPFEQLVGHVNSSKKISLVSKRIHDFFQMDPLKKMNQVFSGTCVFNKNKPKSGLQVWRISNDGVRFVRPYLESNLLPISREMFLFLIRNQNSIDFKEFPESLSEELEAIKLLENNSYCAIFQEGKDREEEMFVVLKMPSSMVLMICKEEINGLRIKYLN